MNLEEHLEKRWGHRSEGEVVLLDNRDSFVFNLAHRFAELGTKVVVARSDQLTLAELIDWNPRALVLSPGPGHPRDAGISVEAVDHFSGGIPILGICLGHQAIASAFGGTVAANSRPMHGKASLISHGERGLFSGLPNPLEAGRYHSLVAGRPLPEALEITARADGFVMALEHREHATFGVQFHPESVLTATGRQLLGNFLECVPESATPPTSLL